MIGPDLIYGNAPLIIKSLPPDVSSTSLIDVFGNFGIEAKVQLNPIGSNEIGRIVFRYPEDAEKFYVCTNNSSFVSSSPDHCIQFLTPPLLNPPPSIPIPNPISVYYLPRTITVFQVYDTFRSFGTILGIRLREEKDGIHTSALIRFLSWESGDHILKEVHGQVIAGNVVSIRWYAGPKASNSPQPNGGPSSATPSAPPNSSSSFMTPPSPPRMSAIPGRSSAPVFIPVPPNAAASDAVPISAFFTRTATGSNRPASAQPWQQLSVQNGFGTVGNNNNMHMPSSSPLSLSVSPSHSPSSLSRPPTPPTSPTPLDTRNLYIKNLPTSFTSKDLQSLFSGFGTVVSCRVMSNADGTSKGFGFVAFSHNRSALNAKLSVHGLDNGIGGRFVVTVAEPREYREEKLKHVWHERRRREELRGRSN